LAFLTPILEKFRKNALTDYLQNMKLNPCPGNLVFYV
jgi:hypothetical protein